MQEIDNLHSYIYYLYEKSQNLDNYETLICPFLLKLVKYLLIINLFDFIL